MWTVSLLKTCNSSALKEDAQAVFKHSEVDAFVADIWFYPEGVICEIGSESENESGIGILLFRHDDTNVSFRSSIDDSIAVQFADGPGT